MSNWNITVRVDYNFDVEAETQEQAEKIAWDNYAKLGVDVQIVEIWTEEETEDKDEDEDNEPDESWFDGDALASAGHGTDEDYGYYGDE
jgi:hypothetical protein